MKTLSKALTRFAQAAFLLLLSFTLVGQAVGQTWTYTGSMNEVRRGPAAALLEDGRVLVAGGHNASGPLNTAELYDPATGTWTATDSMEYTLQSGNGRAVRLQDGRVLVTGGSVQADKAEIYDPTAGTWTAVPSMANSRCNHTATLLQNGKVLVVGGTRSGTNFFQATAEVYDPSGNTWSSTGSMSMGRWLHAAVLLPDGRVLVAGGEKYYIPGPTTGLRSTEIYDPGTGTWSAASDLNVPRAIHTANVLLDGTVLVSGGAATWYIDYWRMLGTDTAEIYDPASDTWILTGSLSDWRSSHSSTLLMDGTVLVAGGEYTNVPDDPRVTVPTTELYDPTTGSWTLMGDLNEARDTHVAILLSDGSVLVAGGTGGGGNAGALSTAELFGVVPIVLTVQIDIKPGSYPNSINLGSNGVIPLAILSSEEFDATTVDEATVELAGAGVSIRGKNHYLADVEDVNGDGLPDLVCHVETENLSPDTFQDGYAQVTGQTSDGQQIEGWDEVTIVPPE